MNHNDIHDFESESSKGKLKIRMMNLENGLLILISDTQNFRIGISAIAIPPGQNRSEPTSTSIFSTGPDPTFVRTIAERVAKWNGQTCMLMIAVKGIDRTLMMEILTILKDNLLT